MRLELQMEIEQRSLVSYLHSKGMKLPVIVAKLAAVYHEDAFDESRAHYRLHEIKSHRSDHRPRLSSDGPPLEDIDARIQQVFEAEPWSSVRTIAEFFKIPASTGRLHLTTSLNGKSWHFNWVPRFLYGDLREKRLEGA
jgi:hypothetical protein